MNDAPIDPTQTRQVVEHKHDRPLLACTWAADGAAVYYAAEDNSVRRLTLDPLAATPLPQSHDSWVRALAPLPDGSALVTGGYDGRLAWHPTAGGPSRTVDAHTGWIRAVAVSPDGRLVASCGNDRLVKLWDATSAVEVARCPGHESHVYEIAWRPDGGSLVSCDLKGVVKEWSPTGAAVREVATAAALWKYDEGFRADIGGARAIGFRADGSQLALGGITKVSNAFAGIGKPAIVLLEWADGKEARVLEAKDSPDGVCWGVVWHPAGYWIGLAGGGGGGWLRFFKGDVPEEFHSVKLPANGRGLSLAPDTRRVAVALADGSLRVFALHA